MIIYAKIDGSDSCECRDCLSARKALDDNGWPVLCTRMILCPECGDKRCPHADNHMNECTHKYEKPISDAILR